MPESKDYSPSPKPSAKRYERTPTLQPSLRSTLVSYHNGKMRVKVTISRLPPYTKPPPASINRQLSLHHRTFREQLEPDQSSTAKVLITVSLDDTVPPNLTEWRNWLRRQVPTNVAEIEVEGVFEGNSKVVSTSPSGSYLGHATGSRRVQLRRLCAVVQPRG
jgi:hypothetical protein